MRDYPEQEQQGKQLYNAENYYASYRYCIFSREEAIIILIKRCLV
jgi:hypothetical protein